MKPKILIPLPSRDFDPTEVAIPWKILSDAGLDCVFATPDGAAGICDTRMLDGRGLGPLKAFLIADRNSQSAYREMEASPAFKNPIMWAAINARDFEGLILPGGHAPGVREYLESSLLQLVVASFFVAQKPIGAICHGVVLASRSQVGGVSVLRGRKTTALLRSQEMAAWLLTKYWLGTYYRTYARTVEDEVRASLAQPDDFRKGPAPLRRDSLECPEKGFALVDGNYVSARWPGDAHQFALTFCQVFQERSNSGRSQNVK